MAGLLRQTMVYDVIARTCFSIAQSDILQIPCSARLMHLCVSVCITYRPISRHMPEKAFTKWTGHKSPATVRYAPAGQRKAVMEVRRDPLRRFLRGPLRDILPIASESLAFTSLGACPFAPHPGDVRITKLPKGPDNGPVRPVVPQGKPVHLLEHSFERQVLKGDLY